MNQSQGRAKLVKSSVLAMSATCVAGDGTSGASVVPRGIRGGCWMWSRTRLAISSGGNAANNPRDYATA